MVQQRALEYVAERERQRELTRRTATNVLGHLLDFGRRTAVAPDQLTPQHVRVWMDRPDLAASTLRNRLSDLRGFCQWLVINGHLDRDPTVGMKGPRVPDLRPRNLQADEARRLVQQAPDARGRLIVLLMLQEGLRCIEVARAELGDVDQCRMVIDLRGKGGREGVTRTVPLSAETSAALDEYLDEHPATSGPLVRSYQYPRRGLTSTYIGKLVGRWMRAAGVKRLTGDGKSAHSCRHTAASDMVEGGADIWQVQRALGHRNIKSTLVYLRGVTPDLRAAMGGRNYTTPDERRIA